MSRDRYQGSITVFLSLVGVLLIALVCALAESARIQGARAWAAAVTDMGLFSVFGEYERELLENYDVLLLDGAFGTGDFSPERVAWRMQDYMKYNTSPIEGLKKRAVNLFPMTAESCQITGYTLATDENGNAFYQQVVEGIRENLGMELLLRFQKDIQEAKRQQEAAEEYENQDASAWDNLEKVQELQKEADGEEEQADPEPVQEAPQENPLDTIKKIKEMGILGLVVKEPAGISEKRVEASGLPSNRKRNKGNLPLKETEKGLISDGIFQEYLLGHFSAWTDPWDQEGLAYQMEYILIGKNSDKENLKGVVNRLLLLREGVNLVYILSDTKMRTQIKTLALGLGGAAPVPGLCIALEAVLALAWAYAESLLDVRTLLSKGRVPPMKDASSWKLSLSNLAKVTELFDSCDDGGGTGQDYEDYLRILLFAGKKGRYPLRALDMMESSLGDQRARADGWIVRAKAETAWRFSGVFFRVTEAFLPVTSGEAPYRVTGELEY